GRCRRPRRAAREADGRPGWRRRWPLRGRTARGRTLPCGNTDRSGQLFLPMPYELPHLRALEAELVHVLREVAAEFERPVLLFSGGKDSIVMLRLAEKAFWPARLPFPLMHVDTGHNFGEVLEYRDRRVAELGCRLVVASVQESIDGGRVVGETGPRANRNRAQTTMVLEAMWAPGYEGGLSVGRRW